MITNVSKNIQRAKSYSHEGLLKLFTVLYLLNQHMPNLNKCIQLCTKSRMKTKKNRKNTYMLLDSNPHLFSAKLQDCPLDYRGILIKFIQISNNRTISSELFTKFQED